MKILYVCSTEYQMPLPPGAVQAAMRLAGQIAEGIQKKGHEVTYFGAGDSRLEVAHTVNAVPPFFSVYNREQLLAADRMTKSKLLQAFQSRLHVALLEYLRHEHVDIVHFHSTPPFFSLPYSPYISAQKVFTFHDPLTAEYNQIFKEFGSDPSNHYVSISDAQRLPVPDINYAGTAYNGIDISPFTYNETPEDYMISIGRIMPIKGITQAIDAALKTHHRLIIGGQEDQSLQAWLDADVLSHVDHEHIEYLKQLDYAHVPGHMARAKLLIFPIQWEEPFGLVMVEAMASGTPVVAFARGSTQEVVKDGVTGFLVNASDQDIRGDFIVKKTGQEGLYEAIQRIYDIPHDQYIAMRRASRAHAEQSFTLSRMIDRYEEIYMKIMESHV